MKERGQVTVAGILLTILISVVLVHTTLHFAVYGTDIAGYGEKGISGFSIGGVSAGELNTNYPQISPLSKKILIIEWTVLALATLATLASFLVERIRSKKEIIEVTRIAARGKSKTDLDLLYDVLKEKKRLKLSMITKMFNVQDATVIEWARIFEAGNLALLSYPRIGEPELIITTHET